MEPSENGMADLAKLLPDAARRASEAPDNYDPMVVRTSAGDLVKLNENDF